MKCKNCKLDLSTDSNFLKGVTKTPKSGDLVGYEILVECPHCKIQQYIPIGDYHHFCGERYERLLNISQGVNYE